MNKPELADAVKQLALAGEEHLKAHPSAATLAAYHRRELSAEEADRVQGHLGLCRDCAALVIDLASWGTSPEGDSEVELSWHELAQRPRKEGGEVLQMPTRILAAPPLPRWAYATAAVFFVCTCLLALWVIQLQRSLRHQVQPQANIAMADLEATTSLRSDEATHRLEVPAGTARFVLILHPRSPAASGIGGVRILDQEAREVWQTHRLVATEYGNFTLDLSRDFLPAGRYRIELFAEEQTEEPLDTFLLDLAFR